MLKPYFQFNSFTRRFRLGTHHHNVTIRVISFVYRRRTKGGCFFRLIA